MKPQPSSFHGDDSGYQKALAAYRRKRDWYFLLGMLHDISGILMIIAILCYSVYNFPSEFSVKLTPVRGLVVPASGASIFPAFNVTLHADNQRATERCYRGDSEAVVSYAGFTVAVGRVPGFCVPGKGAREVPFMARADGVGLPEHVRDRMAVEGRGGAAQLEVEVKLLRRDHGSPRPTWISCAVMMDGAPPPIVAPCTVLALQNWFSQYNAYYISVIP